MVTIAILNRSERVEDADVEIMARACDLQIRSHAARAWSRRTWRVRFHRDEETVRPTQPVIYVLDDESQLFGSEAPADAVAYHTEDDRGRRYGTVLVDLIGDGEDVYLYDDPESVSVALSHEVLEMFIDPDVNLFAEDAEGEMVMLEVCDPVQDDAYTIDVDGHPIHVSNFVYPSWFDWLPPDGAVFDHLRLLDRPFRVRPGGYAPRHGTASTRSRTSPVGSRWRRLRGRRSSRTRRRLARSPAARRRPPG